jgi:acyl carrier protein
VSSDRTRLDVSTLVRQELRSLLEEAGNHAGDIAPSDVLTEELGLSSAQVAQLLARIGTRLGIVSPMESFTDVRTLADLCALYQPQAPTEPRRGETDPLESSRRRAEARRSARRA